MLLHGLHSRGLWNASILNAIVLTSKKGRGIALHLMIPKQNPQRSDGSLQNLHQSNKLNPRAEALRTRPAHLSQISHHGHKIISPILFPYSLSLIFCMSSVKYNSIFSGKISGDIDSYAC